MDVADGTRKTLTQDWLTDSVHWFVCVQFCVAFGFDVETFSYISLFFGAHAFIQKKKKIKIKIIHCVSYHRVFRTLSTLAWIVHDSSIRISVGFSVAWMFHAIYLLDGVLNLYVMFFFSYSSSSHSREYKILFFGKGWKHFPPVVVVFLLFLCWLRGACVCVSAAFCGLENGYILYTIQMDICMCCMFISLSFIIIVVVSLLLPLPSTRQQQSTYRQTNVNVKIQDENHSTSNHNNNVTAVVCVCVCVCAHVCVRFCIESVKPTHVYISIRHL